MKFYNLLRAKRAPSTSSALQARGRLERMVTQQRSTPQPSSNAQPYRQQNAFRDRHLKKELLAVIQKYTETDRESIHIQLSENQTGGSMVTLILELPRAP